MKTSRNELILIGIAFLAFISLGLPDGLLGISWPFISTKTGVPLDSLGSILLAMLLGFVSTSVLSGYIMARFSMGWLIAVSCVTTSLSLFVVAASPDWLVIIVASFFLGAGAGAIDTSFNIFASVRFSPAVINWLHAFYGVGATAGPVLLTWLFTHRQSWESGYLIVACIQMTLAVLFFFTAGLWGRPAEKHEQPEVVPWRETIGLPMVWIGIFVFFLYTGFESSMGQWTFTVLLKSRNLPESEASARAGFFWASLTFGRILFGIVLTRIAVGSVLKMAFPGIAAGVLLLSVNAGGTTDIIGIIFAGFFCAPVFPLLITLTPVIFGNRHAPGIIGYQSSAAMLGAALIPGALGLLADFLGWTALPAVLFVLAVFMGLLVWALMRKTA
ncbi:MAG: MFS transporter [Bacteroidota bacterium]|jgi:fucose permease